MDRWWMIGLAFLAAAGMVLLVLLTTGDQGATGMIRPASVFSTLI
jgi:hypothetical protein